MIAKNMEEMVNNSSTIRAMFEEGKKLCSIYGKENVYDFSLGNPSAEPPSEVKAALADIIQNEPQGVLHGYMNNAGYEDVRGAIANHINENYGTQFTEKNILMTVGAAGGLNVVLKTILDPEDQVIAFAPYFGEYKNYVGNFGGELVVVPPNTANFQPDIESFRSRITNRTKAVIINSPNNPTGVIYSEQTVRDICRVLEEKETAYGKEIYLIADEPYRELAYDGTNVPYITKFYRNSLVVYSFSKSLSLPGERIGYVVMPSEMTDSECFINAATTANRILGFVNAPSLFQKAISKCLAAKVDLEEYDRNRRTLYEGLTAMGYECILPQGAFYLFVKSPVEDEEVFCRVARENRVLIVKGEAFGCKGYVRMAYCVPYETIQGALPQMEQIMKQLKAL